MKLQRDILWVDSLSGLFVGTVMLLASGWLHKWYGLPERLLIFMGLVNLLYGAYSLTLARRSKRSKLLIWILVAANLSWAPFCIAFAIAHIDTATILGNLQLYGEAAYVVTLAYFEWRWRESLITS